MITEENEQNDEKVYFSNSFHKYFLIKRLKPEIMDKV